MFNLDELKRAVKIIYDFMPATPQCPKPLLSQILEAETWVKHENYTPTGAFKVRGSLILMSKRREQGKIKGIITASSGNSGQSLAFAGAEFDIPVTIVVPENSSKPESNATIKSFGAELIVAGTSFDEAEDIAKQVAITRNLDMISTFDSNLVLGVATYAYELLNELKDLDIIYVPVATGSGICGLIRVRDLLGLSTKIIGVVPENSCSLAKSFLNKKIVEANCSSSIADGLVVKKPNPDSFKIMLNGAENIMTVTEKEIYEAIRLYYKTTRNVAEGASATALAAAIKDKGKNIGGKIGIILSGSNIDMETFAQALNVA